MRKLLFIPFILLSIDAYSQMNTFGGIGLRVNDTTTYQTNAAAYHTAGYYDIYFNNQATNDHWDIWNGSSYDHIFNFGSGGSGGWLTAGQTDLTGDVLINGTTFGMTFMSEKPIYIIGTSGNKSFGFYTFPEAGGEQHVGAVAADVVAGIRTYFYAQVDSIALIAENQNDGDSTRILLKENEINLGLHSGADLKINDNPGTSGQVIKSNGSNVPPTWGSPGLTASATLNFDLTAVNSQDLTITVTGAADGDVVSIGHANAAATANVIYTAWVSGTNTVTVRASRIDVATGANPGSATFKALVFK